MKNPESEFVLDEIILRDIVLKEETLLSKVATTRWLVLSLGLINLNESRTLLVDILQTLFKFQKKQGASVKEIYDEISKKKKYLKKQYNTIF